jgi:superfamily II DNA or RNA helicase
VSVVLRPYQAEDVAKVIEAHKTHRRVIGRKATGLGKAVELAALAQHYARFGRVMVLVDVKKLVRQLAHTIEWYTGTAPGIEMGDERAVNGGTWHAPDPIVVSTVQTQYSGVEGYERFRQFDPAEFSAVLLDECELFLAPKARSVVDWYLNGNAALVAFGCTATPMRGDGVAMGNLFDHVAFDRDILWGIKQGYLVPARQAFVKVSVDFSTLKLRKGDDGESDYSDADLADKLKNEKTLIELAEGIRHVCGDRRTIVVCPDVASARAVAHYLEAERGGCAKCVYGELGDVEKDDIMDSHQRGDFQYLTSVMMLTKGYDDKQVRAVVNCRKTKSKRLYQQILGRGTRPLEKTVDGVETAEGRRAAIAASAKPDMVMVNMVGVSERVRDVTLVDILGVGENQAVIDRAKEIVEETGADTEEAIAQAEEEQELEREAEKVRAQVEAAKEEQAQAIEFDRRLRRMVDVKADVEVEYRDDLSGGGGMTSSPEERLPAGQMRILRNLGKLTDAEINALTLPQSADLTRVLMARKSLGLCSYRQGKLLQRFGYAKGEIQDMTAGQAREAIDAIKENGWRRPDSEVLA